MIELIYMNHEIQSGLGIYTSDLDDQLFFRATSEADDRNMYEHGPAHIFADEHSDEEIGRFAREILLKCQPGIAKVEVDRLYEMNFLPMLKSLGLQNKTEFFKRFRRCALYVYAHEYYGLETQIREGRNNYSTVGEIRKLPLTVLDAELGAAILETLAKSS